MTAAIAALKGTRRMSSSVATREVLPPIETRLESLVPIEAIRSWIRFIHDDILSAGDGNWGGSPLPFGVKPIRLAWDLRRLCGDYETFCDLFVDLLFARDPDLCEVDCDTIRAHWQILDRSQNENDILLIDAMERFAHGATDWEAPAEFIEIIDKLTDLSDAERVQMTVEEGIDVDARFDASPARDEERTAAVELRPFAEFRAKRIKDRAAYDAEWQRIWGIIRSTLARRDITEEQRQVTYAQFERAETELKRKYAHLWPISNNHVPSPPGTPGPALRSHSIR